MNRVNFARCSSVIVDVCRAHGTWFDQDELRRMVEFIRNGGLEKARTKEQEELKAEQRRARQAAAARDAAMGLPPSSRDNSQTYDSISVAADALMDFLLHR
jgi:Zn-finger nucleic acid-binding protein